MLSDAMKLKLSFILLLILLVSRSNAQDSHFSFAIEYSIGISDRIIGSGDPTINVGVDISRDLEQEKLGHTIGLLFSNRINNNLTITTGVSYTEWGFRSPGNIPFNTGGVEPSLSIRAEGINKYIEIPLKLSYYFKAIQEGFFIRLGCAPNYNIRNKNLLTIQSALSPEEFTTAEVFFFEQKWNLLLEVGLGYEKQIGQQLAYYFAPNFRIQAIPLTMSDPLNRSLFFYGLTAGIKI